MTYTKDINSIYSDYNKWFKNYIKDFDCHFVIISEKNVCHIASDTVKKDIDVFFKNTDAKKLEIKVSKHRHTV